MEPYRFTDFAIGWVSQTSAFISNNLKKFTGLRAAAVADNVYLDETGMRSILGYAKWNPVALPGNIQGGHVHYNEATNTKRLLVAANGNIYHFTDGAFVSLKSGLSTTAKVRFKTWNGYTIIMNGVNPVMQYDGSTVADVTFLNPTPPLAPVFPADARPTWMEVFENRGFYTGCPVYPYRYWSPEPGTHNNFSTGTADFRDVNVGDGQRVTAIVPLTLGYALIFKTGSTFTMEGSGPADSDVNPAVIKDLSREVGCPAPDTIVTVGTRVLFLAANGYREVGFVRDNGIVIDFSEPFDAIRKEFTGMDQNNLGKASAVFNKDDRLIYLSVPKAAGGFALYVYHTKTGGVMNRTRPGVLHQWYGDNTHFWAVSGSNHLYLNNSGTLFDTDPIPWRWQSLWWDGGSNNLRKRFQRLSVLFSQIGTGGVKVGLSLLLPDTSVVYQQEDRTGSTNIGWDSGLWDNVLWDAVVGLQYRRARCGLGNAIKISLSGEGPFKLDNIAFMAEGRGSNQR